MANNFTADFAEIWAKEQQRIFYKENVSLKIADISFKAIMKAWDTLNRPYRSSNAIQSYTPWTAITIDDKTATNEQLSINRKFASWFYVDDFDAIQSNYDQIAAYASDDAVYLSNQVDADVLWEYWNATSTVDDGTIWGTSWNWITLSTSNVLKVMSAAKKKLAKQNIPLNDLFWVISPEFEDMLIQYWAGRDTTMWDEANKNWFLFNFYWFSLYRSNQTAWSAVLSMATTPSDWDIVVISGVTFTFKTTLWATAGNVAIWWSADAARANLTWLINAPSTTDSNWVALSTNNARIFANQYTATNSNSADTMTLVAKWVWTLVVSKTFTDGTDTWTATKQKQHNLFGKKWAITLVMQSDTKVQIRPVQDKLWRNVLNWVLYWLKTFLDWAKQLVNVVINSSSF